MTIPFWRRRRAGARGAYEAAFSQSPHGMLVVDGGSLDIVDANPALQASLGFTLHELRKMPLAQIFSDEGGPPEALLAQLRQAPATLLIETGQRCRSGRFLYVEISGYRLEVRDRGLYALTTRDITMRRRMEAQLHGEAPQHRGRGGGHRGLAAAREAPPARLSVRAGISARAAGALRSVPAATSLASRSISPASRRPDKSWTRPGAERGAGVCGRCVRARLRRARPPWPRPRRPLRREHFAA